MDKLPIEYGTNVEIEDLEKFMDDDDEIDSGIITDLSSGVFFAINFRKIRPSEVKRNVGKCYFMSSYYEDGLLFVADEVIKVNDITETQEAANMSVTKLPTLENATLLIGLCDD